jgi:hypothetical protein
VLEFKWLELRIVLHDHMMALSARAAAEVEEFDSEVF